MTIAYDGTGFAAEVAKLKTTLNLKHYAYSSARNRADRYRDEALAWRMFYEELRPFIASTVGSEGWIKQADEMLEGVRNR